MSMVLMTAAGLSHGASSAPLGRCARAVASVDALLELKGVHTHIGAYHILHGVDLVVPKGQLTMLLGRNGAGKTTTLRTIMGLWQASKGAVRFAGRDITALHTPQIAGMNIAYQAAEILPSVQTCSAAVAAFFRILKISPSKSPAFSRKARFSDPFSFTPAPADGFAPSCAVA